MGRSRLQPYPPPFPRDKGDCAFKSSPGSAWWLFLSAPSAPSGSITRRGAPVTSHSTEPAAHITDPEQQRSSS
ncbi:hypothetical protein PFLUV_G00064990 [Perca fluviatilis]|uniref:Uncharacterized protein n=1 Tax=Perca fluviatilis TaxID=8168 RepID=A0A6A5FFJ2_PERFL|nr:hypothetical protein PFLUV_G00064990 [Perca fluviatilis]